MKIVFYEIEPWEGEYIKEGLSGMELVFHEEKLTEETLEKAKDAVVISPFIYSTLKKDIVEKLSGVKLVATRSTGFDHIDTAFCKEKGIVVCNVPTYGAHTVAEHTFALIFALSRRLIPSVERSRRGDFSLEGLRGFDLYGKTLGVIGTGNIGKRVIAIARGIGMKVIAHSRTQDEDLKKQGVQFVDLPTVLSFSDIITLHVPHNDSTHHLINMQNIAQIKKGALLINTARGPIVETQAVLEGLQQKILAGVGLDVLEEECSLKEERELLTSEFLKSCDLKNQLMNHMLLTRDDVVITPHNAFNSKEALQQILDTTVANIQAFLEGKPINMI